MQAAVWMVMWTALQGVAQLPAAEPEAPVPVAPATEIPTLLEVDCTLPAGRVVVTGGRVLTSCPGFQRVVVQGARDLEIVVMLGHQRSVEKTVPMPLEKLTRVRVLQEGGSPRLEVLTYPVPAEEQAAAPMDSFPVEETAETPTAGAPAKAAANPWKARATGAMLVVGLGVFVLGLSAAATAGTRMLVGSEPLAGTFPTTGLYGVFNSITLLTSPALLALGLGACVLGIGAMTVGFFWGRNQWP